MTAVTSFTTIVYVRCCVPSADEDCYPVLNHAEKFRFAPPGFFRMFCAYGGQPSGSPGKQGRHRSCTHLQRGCYERGRKHHRGVADRSSTTHTSQFLIVVGGSSC